MMLQAIKFKKFTGLLRLPSFLNLFIIYKNSEFICLLETGMGFFKFYLQQNLLVMYKLYFILAQNFNYYNINTILAKFAEPLFGLLFLYRVRFFFKGIGYKLHNYFFGQRVLFKVIFGYSHKLKYNFSFLYSYFKIVGRKLTFFEVLSLNVSELAFVIFKLKKMRRVFRYKRKGFFVLKEARTRVKKSKKQQQR